MSIWASVGYGLTIPGRDNYTGDPAPDIDAGLVDVATSWHELIRLSISGGQFGTGAQEVLITATEARQLIATLHAALERLEPS